MSKRIEYLDIAKGIGILLVVLGHNDFEVISVFVQRLIYSFHMPLFFFLCGLFVVPRLSRGPAKFRSSLWRSVAWPYFLWSAVQIIAIWTAGSLVNSPVDDLGGRLVSILWAPPSQFWFLYGLFLFHLTAIVIVPRLPDPAVLVVAMAIASLALLARFLSTLRS